MVILLSLTRAMLNPLHEIRSWEVWLNGREPAYVNWVPGKPKEIGFTELKHTKGEPTVQVPTGHRQADPCVPNQSGLYSETLLLKRQRKGWKELWEGGMDGGWEDGQTCKAGWLVRIWDCGICNASDLEPSYPGLSLASYSHHCPPEFALNTLWLFR